MVVFGGGGLGGGGLFWFLVWGEGGGGVWGGGNPIMPRRAGLPMTSDTRSKKKKKQRLKLAGADQEGRGALQSTTRRKRSIQKDPREQGKKRRARCTTVLKKRPPEGR